MFVKPLLKEALLILIKCTSYLPAHGGEQDGNHFPLIVKAYSSKPTSMYQYHGVCIN